MEVGCFKYIRKELQQGTNWTVVIEKTGVIHCERDVGEMERNMRAMFF